MEPQSRISGGSRSIDPAPRRTTYDIFGSLAETLTELGGVTNNIRNTAALILGGVDSPDMEPFGIPNDAPLYVKLDQLNSYLKRLLESLRINGSALHADLLTDGGDGPVRPTASLR